MIIQPTSEKAAEYAWFGKQCLDLGETGRKLMQDGMYTVICEYTPDKAVLLVIGGGSFISTPRLFGRNDGYLDDVAQGEGSLAYPLDDLTETSQVLTIDNPPEVERSVHLYGNIDWIGPNSIPPPAKDSTEAPDSDAVVLTWKGPPGRLVPFDTSMRIPGLTEPDIQFSLEAGEVFTCFGPNVYSGGEIFATAPTVGDVPPKILGCALQGETLVCIINNHYAERLGFMEEVWLNRGADGLWAATNLDGWEKLYERTGQGRPTRIWAFNQSGTRSTQGIAEYSIDVAGKAVTYDAGSSGRIQARFEKDVAGNHKVIYSGEQTVWSDYQGDQRVFAKVAATGQGMFEGSTLPGGARNAEVPIYVEGQKPTEGRYIFGSETPEVGSTYVVTGGPAQPCCEKPFIWSMDGGKIDPDTGVVLEITGCGMGSIMAYACSANFSMPVRLPGKWELTSECGEAALGPATGELVSGSTRVVEWVNESNSAAYCYTHQAIREWSGYGFCFDNTICTAMGINPATLEGSCGSPTISYIPSLESWSFEGSYPACAPDYGTVTYSVNVVATVWVGRRETYTWVCP